MIDWLELESSGGDVLSVYIRLVFAYSQDWQARQAASHASMPGRFQSVVRLERPAIEKKYWKEVLWSPSYFAATCGGGPIQHIEEVHRAAENLALTF